MTKFASHGELEQQLSVHCSFLILDKSAVLGMRKLTFKLNRLYWPAHRQNEFRPVISSLLAGEMVALD